MADQHLLSLLADGNFHSGEELGQKLGVSRTAIWKQVGRVAALGVEIESVKSKGYRIPGGLKLLEQSVIERQLSGLARRRLKELSIEQSISSTNALAREKAEVGDATGQAIIAEQQMAGRGRRGRSWISPFGRNIYLSLAWGFEGGATAIEGLSLAVGVAVRRSLQRCGVNGVDLKWPNDLLWEGRKLGGILLEIVGDPAGFCQVVVGVGLNVDMRDEEAEGIDQQWAGVNQIAHSCIDRNVLAGCLLDELLLVVGEYEQKGFAAYRDEWMQYDAFAGQPVRLVTVTREIKGVARGVTSSGALQLDIDGETRAFSGGEISLRSDQ